MTVCIPIIDFEKVFCMHADKQAHPFSYYGSSCRALSHRIRESQPEPNLVIITQVTS